MSNNAARVPYERTTAVKFRQGMHKDQVLQAENDNFYELTERLGTPRLAKKPHRFLHR